MTGAGWKNRQGAIVRWRLIDKGAPFINWKTVFHINSKRSETYALEISIS